VRHEATLRGRFVRALSYSGPSVGVRVERDAGASKAIYLDRREAFTGLPSELAGADYVLAAQSDRSTVRKTSWS